MWDRLASLPWGIQSLFCPSRASESLLLAIGAWLLGFFCGSFITALFLSPLLRRILTKVVAVVAYELAPVNIRGREGRLARYRDLHFSYQKRFSLDQLFCLF